MTLPASGDVPELLFAVGLSVALAIAVTLIALGEETFRDWAAVRDGFRPADAQAAEREIARIAAMRDDPEIGNMFFLSRFLVMVVQEAVGQMLAGLLAAWSFTEDVNDKIIEAPFAVAALWLAFVCLLTYRRIGGFSRWSERLRARAGRG